MPDWVINPEQNELQLLSEISYYIQQLNFSVRLVVMIIGIIIVFMISKWLYKYVIGYWINKAFRQWMP